jgi:hypothetical protein
LYEELEQIKQKLDINPGVKHDEAVDAMQVA